jgi:Nitroreductase
MALIFERRSIRHYTNQPVAEDLVVKILKAGMAAPSAGNAQPWQFIIINERELMDEIPKFHPYSQMLKEASVAIAVCGDLTLEKYPGFWVQDCSAAMENMLLMAVELALGSVWLGVYPMEERIRGVKRLLNLPENVIPLGIMPLGYPVETKERIERFDETRVHRNHW